MFTISVLLVQKSVNQLDCQRFELIKQSSGNALNKSSAIFTCLGLPTDPTSPVPVYRSASVHCGTQELQQQTGLFAIENIVVLN